MLFLEKKEVMETQIMTDFLNDVIKMRDFYRLTKQEFLKSYPSICEIAYNLTRAKDKYKNEQK